MSTPTSSSMPTPALLVRRVPQLSRLRSYQREWPRFDGVTGLTKAGFLEDIGSIVMHL